MAEITPGMLGAAFFIQGLITAFFCLTLYRTLLLTDEENRSIKPNMVWLLLIPGFSIIWNFVIIPGMAKSLYNEFVVRNFEIEERPGLIYGMIYASLSVLYPISFFLSTNIPALAVAASVMNLAGIVFFVQYWIKINWFKKILENDRPETDES